MSTDPLASEVRQHKAWSDFAYSIGGRIEHGEGFTSRVHTPDYRGWEFLVDSFEARDELLERSHWWTRIRAPYEAASSLRFQLRPAGWSARARRLVGGPWSRYFRTGDPKVDRLVAIRTGSEREIRELLAVPTIREMLTRVGPLDLDIAEVFEEGVSPIRERIEELRFRERIRISDADRLIALVELLAEMLDRLQEMGVAKRRDRSVYSI